MTTSSPTMAGGSSQTGERIELQLRYAFNYLLHLPDGYEADTASIWPLLIFLHGSGESGSDLSLVKSSGPPKLIAEGRHFPFIVISPQCPDGSWWESLALEAFIDEMQRRYRVDASRVYLTGLSMGGYATWDLAERRPERYAAILPICGAGNPLRAGQLRDMQVWAFHGAHDDIVPVRGTQDMIDAIRAAGGSPRLTIYPDAGHDSWTQTYANEEIYIWLLRQHGTPVSV